MLSQWYAVKFVDSAAWFQARLAFTRTTAVMSMVGYIVGCVGGGGGGMAEAPHVSVCATRARGIVTVTSDAWPTRGSRRTSPPTH